MTRRERWIPYAFLLPAFLGLLIFQLVPIVFGLGRSLYATGFGELAGRLSFVVSRISATCSPTRCSGTRSR